MVLVVSLEKFFIIRRGIFLLLLLVWLGFPVGTQAYSLYLPLIIKIPQFQNGDFEKGADGSWRESSTNGLPLILAATDLQGLIPQGGNWAVWLGGQINETSSLSQGIFIPENAATLNFYYWIESYELPENCGFDFAYVRFGSTTLRTYDLCEPRNTNQWVLGQIDLTAYRGQAGELVFELVNDEIDHSNFFLDTISISPTVP
jgi:hypothetical protein